MAIQKCLDEEQMALIDYAIKATGNGFAVMPNKPGPEPMLDTSLSASAAMMSRCGYGSCSGSSRHGIHRWQKPSGNLEVISFETMDAYHKAVAWIRTIPCGKY